MGAFLYFKYILSLILHDLSSPGVIHGFLGISFGLENVLIGKCLLYSSVYLLINMSYASAVLPVCRALRDCNQSSSSKADANCSMSTSFTVLKDPLGLLFKVCAPFPNQSRIGKWSDRSLTIIVGSTIIILTKV